MASAAIVTAMMAKAAKNSFAEVVAQGGVGLEDYVSYLMDFVVRAKAVKYSKSTYWQPLERVSPCAPKLWLPT